MDHGQWTMDFVEGRVRSLITAILFPGQKSSRLLPYHNFCMRHPVAQFVGDGAKGLVVCPVV